MLEIELAEELELEVEPIEGWLLEDRLLELKLELRLELEVKVAELELEDLVLDDEIGLELDDDVVDVAGDELDCVDKMLELIEERDVVEDEAEVGDEGLETGGLNEDVLDEDIPLELPVELMEESGVAEDEPDVVLEELVADLLLLELDMEPELLRLEEEDAVAGMLLLELDELEV